MMQQYQSPWEAYPFLRDDADDLRCDFEILTDEISSRIGLLRAKTRDRTLKQALLRVCELVYHANPTLRTHFSVDKEEILWLSGQMRGLEAQNRPGSSFVLPVGCEEACEAHVIRVRCKALVRLVYRHLQNGGKADEGLLDLCNLLSGYFFVLAMELNRQNGVEEITFTSRNY